MPALAFVALVGLVLVSLVASDLYGLPKVSRHRHLSYTTHVPYTTQNLATAPAPAPDMTSPLVLAAQPKDQSVPDVQARIESASPPMATRHNREAFAARAETQHTTDVRTARAEAQRTTAAHAARAEAQRTTAAHAARAEATRMQPPSVAISRPLGGREFGLSGGY